MALAEIEPVPFLYVVDDVVLMVTFWSAGVVIVKLDFDTVSTVPVDPPAAGPDRSVGSATGEPRVCLMPRRATWLLMGWCWRLR